MLLAAGANMHARDDFALGRATQQGHPEVVRVLRNWPRWAPLRAAFAKQVQEVRWERNAKVAACVDLWLINQSRGDEISAKKEKTAGWFHGDRKRAREG